MHALFAPLLLALLGIAALAVDLGVVTATQARMQTAADVAAVEGLRGQHTVTSLSEEERRQAALDPLVWLMQELGSGPLPGEAPEDSLPAANLGNDPTGDLVAGEVHVGQPAGGATNAHEGLWVRPAGPGESPRDPFPGFEARLRRVSTALDPGASQPGVRNVAPPVPTFFLAGPTSEAVRNDPTAWHRDGWPVRARAVAQARPALVVGNRIPGHDLPGLADLAVTRDAWAALGPAGESAIVQVEASGELRQEGAPFGWRIGTREERDGDSVAAGDRIPRAGGALLQTSSAGRPDFVPVYDTATDHVVGFGWATVEETAPAASGGARRWRVTKQASGVAERNASTAFARDGGLAGASAETLQQIASFARGDDGAEPVLAPALAW